VPWVQQCMMYKALKHSKPCQQQEWHSPVGSFTVACPAVSLTPCTDCFNSLAAELYRLQRPRTRSTSSCTRNTRTCGCEVHHSNSQEHNTAHDSTALRALH